jgi:hypothetical protein
LAVNVVIASVEFGHEACAISWARYQGKTYSYSEQLAMVDETE